MAGENDEIVEPIKENQREQQSGEYQGHDAPQHQSVLRVIDDAVGLRAAMLDVIDDAVVTTIDYKGCGRPHRL